MFIVFLHVSNFLHRGGVQPGETVQVDVPIVPKKLGTRTLLVDVDTKQVKDMKGYAEVEVVSS